MVHIQPQIEGYICIRKKMPILENNKKFRHQRSEHSTQEITKITAE